MTDKEKIREQANIDISNLCVAQEQGIITRFDEGKLEALEGIVDFIDSLQEEPVPKIFKDMLNAKTPVESLGISAKEHDKIIDLCLYGKEPEMVDIDDLPKEEPISNDLKEASRNYAYKEKFRKEVEKLKSNLVHGACSSQIAMETRCKEEAYNDMLAILDTMQDEPVNRTPADVESAMQEVEEKSRVFTEAHKGEDADTILAQMRGEEHVSEELEKAANKYGKDTFVNECMENGVCDKYDLADAFKAGAKWQKEQMMAKAIDGKVIANGMGNPILHLWDKGRHLIGKKVKVILIKEERL